MQYVLEDTCKQLFNLIWFCKKVNIPFDVYAFTNEYEGCQRLEPDELYKKKVGLFAVDNVLHDEPAVKQDQFYCS